MNTLKEKLAAIGDWTPPALPEPEEIPHGDMPGDKVGVRVFEPDGKLAFEKGAVLYWTRHVVPKAERDGLWRIEFTKPSNGDMWGFYAEVAGVRPFFFLTPEKYWFSDSALPAVPGT